MQWQRTLGKRIKTCLIFICRQFKIHRRSRVFLLCKLIRLVTIQLPLAQITSSKPKALAFSDQQLLKITKTVHIKPKRVLVQSCWQESREIWGTKGFWMIKTSSTIHLQFLKRISIREWWASWTGALYQKMLIWLLHLKRDQRQCSLSRWGFMIKVLCT